MLEKVAEVKGSAVEPSALLHVARIAIIGVEVVIPTTISDEVLTVDRATKPLEGVVVAIADLHMIDRRSSTYRTKGETVDLLVLLEGIASKLDADILQHTRVVVGVGATMLRTRTSLYLLGEHAIVVGSLATDDHTTPVARTTAARSLLRGEDDRLCGRTLGNEFATGLHDNSRLGLLVALDDSASRNGQCRSAGHIDPASQQISTFGERLLTLEDKVLVAVADDLALGSLLAFCIEEHMVARLEATIRAPDVRDAGIWWRDRAVIVIITTRRQRGRESEDAEASDNHLACFHHCFVVISCCVV